MGARRPKPTALKERTTVRPHLGLSRLFASANALVPDPQLGSEPDDKTLALDDPRLREPANGPAKSLAEESKYGTVVRVPNLKRSGPLPAETQTGPAMSSRTSITKLKRAEQSRLKDFSAKIIALLFFIPAIGLVTYGLLATDGLTTSARTARKSALTPEQIQERLKYYRTMTGGRLNRERIDVQVQNFQNTPSLDAADHKIKQPSVLDGLPLKGETTAKDKKDLPYDPTYSEAKVAYGLQEEQDRIEFEKRARQAWLSEFIENAHKDGIDVTIDEFGNVDAQPLKQNKSK